MEKAGREIPDLPTLRITTMAENEEYVLGAVLTDETTLEAALAHVPHVAYLIFQWDFVEAIRRKLAVVR